MDLVKVRKSWRGHHTHKKKKNNLMEATSRFFFWRLIYPKLLKNGGKERKKNHKLPQVIKEGEKTISYPNKGKFYTIYFQNFLQNKIVTYRLQIH
uniref:Putative ovule protein n=1 Tax=Solanum chacoense TaxID=4108 RepID=A0A0V0GQ08_SOLCH